MNDSRLHDAADNRTNERHREGIIDVEFKGPLRVILTMVGKNVKECPDKIEAFAMQMDENGRLVQ